MKVSPLAQGTGVPAASEGTSGKSAGPERLARAKAIMNGKALVTQLPTQDPQVEEAESKIKKIKMKTQRSVYRDNPPEQLADEVAASSNIPDKVEQDQSATEETKPIDPQIAVQAQIKRAAQRAAQDKDAEIKDLKAKLAAVNPSESEDYVHVSALKANPLSVLMEKGVTYDQLTEAVISNQQSENNPVLIKLQAEIKALNEKIEARDKLQNDQAEGSKKQVLAQMAKDASKIVAEGDEFELVRETSSVPEVIRLIDETFEATGEVLDVEEALKLVEEELINEGMKFARAKKVLSKIAPAQPQQIQNQNTNNVRTMRTLTNRDGATVPSSARERAIAAFYGRKQ